MRRLLRGTMRAAPLAVILALAGCAVPARETSAVPPVVAVIGRGEVAVRPDTALVRLGAEARQATLDAATADVARRMSAVLERVKAAGVRPEDVATVRYAIEPLTARVRPDADESARIVGYRVTNVVQLKVRDVSAAGRVVDAAVAAGANVIYGVQLAVEDRKAAETLARERAVAAAQATAAQLARAAGARLGPLLSVTEGAAGRPLPERAGGAMALSAVSPGPIEAGEATIAVTVEARYRLEPPAAP